MQPEREMRSDLHCNSAFVLPIYAAFHPFKTATLFDIHTHILLASMHVLQNGGLKFTRMHVKPAQVMQWWTRLTADMPKSECITFNAHI